MAQVKYSNLLCGVLATAAVSAFSYQGACEQMDRTIQEPACQMYDFTPLGDYLSNDYYRIVSERYHIIEKMDILQGFVSNLMENSKDLDPRFATAVDEHFWDLV